MDDTNNTNDQYIDNAVSKIVDMEVSQAYEESKTNLASSTDTTIQTVQNETAAITQRTNAQKELNTEIQKTVVTQEKLISVMESVIDRKTPIESTLMPLVPARNTKSTERDLPLQSTGIVSVKDKDNNVIGALSAADATALKTLSTEIQSMTTNYFQSKGDDKKSIEKELFNSIDKKRELENSSKDLLSVKESLEKELLQSYTDLLKSIVNGNRGSTIALTERGNNTTIQRFNNTYPERELVPASQPSFNKTGPIIIQPSAIKYSKELAYDDEFGEFISEFIDSAKEKIANGKGEEDDERYINDLEEILKSSGYVPNAERPSSLIQDKNGNDIGFLTEKDVSSLNSLLDNIKEIQDDIYDTTTVSELVKNIKERDALIEKAVANEKTFSYSVTGSSLSPEESVARGSLIDFDFDKSALQKTIESFVNGIRETIDNANEKNKEKKAQKEQEKAQKEQEKANLKNKQDVIAKVNDSQGNLALLEKYLSYFSDRVNKVGKFEDYQNNTMFKNNLSNLLTTKLNASIDAEKPFEKEFAKFVSDYQSKIDKVAQLFNSTKDINTLPDDDKKTIAELVSQSEKLNEVFAELTKTTEQQTGITAKNIKQNNLSFDQAKRALVRDKNQQKEYKRLSGTGDFSKSIENIFYNKSNGLKQRSGLVGFAAKFGYESSGTLASVALGGFAAALVTATKELIKFGKECAEQFGEIESIKTNLGVVYGSQNEANSLFNEISAYAQKSPFGVKEVSSQAVLLKQSGIYASDLMKTLKQIGDVAGGNQEKFSNIANAFSQIEANGKATTRQLRQFATAGIPIYEQLSKMLGKSNEEIRKMTEEGKITSVVIERVFDKMTSEGGVFEAAVEKGAKTYKAKKQNFEDTKQLAQAAIGEKIVENISMPILEIREYFWQLLRNWGDVENIKSDVNQIANVDSQTKTVERLMNLLTLEGELTPELKDYFTNYIKNLYGEYDADSRRAIYVSKYKTMASKYNIPLSENKYGVYQDYKVLPDYVFKNNETFINRKNVILDEYKIDEDGSVEYAPYRNKSEFWQEMGKSSIGVVQRNRDIAADPEKYKKNIAEIVKQGIIAEIDNAGAVKQSNQDDFKKETLNTLDSVLETSIKKFTDYGNTLLSKAYNQNPEGISGVVSSESSKWKTTTKGKIEESIKERNKLNKTVEEYEKFRKIIDDNGNIIESYTGTISELSELYNSGIITVQKKINLLKEELASDYYYNLPNDEKEKQKALRQRNDDFAVAMDNYISTIDSIKRLKSTSPELKEDLEKYEKMLTTAVNYDNVKNRAGAVNTLSLVQEELRKNENLKTNVDLEELKVFSQEALNKAGYASKTSNSMVEGYSDTKRKIIAVPVDSLGNLIEKEDLDKLIESYIKTGRTEGLKIVADIDLTDKEKADKAQKELEKVNLVLDSRDLEGLGNTEQGLKKIQNIMQNFNKFLSDEGQTSILDVLSQAFTKKGINKKPYTWEELNASDVLPLWQRVANSTMGIDKNYFLLGKDISGQEMLDIYTQKKQQESVKSILEAGMSSGYKTSDLYKNLYYELDSQGKLTDVIDWNMTAQNLRDFSLQIDSATAVTQAYVNSNSNMIQGLQTFLSSGLTQVEDFANIYDPKYQDLLKETAGKIKALSVQAYNTLFEETEDGMLKVRDSAFKLSSTLVDQMNIVQSLSQTFLNLKTAIDTAENKYMDQTVTKYVKDNLKTLQAGVFKDWQESSITEFLKTSLGSYNSLKNENLSFTDFQKEIDTKIDETIGIISKNFEDEIRGVRSDETEHIITGESSDKEKTELAIIDGILKLFEISKVLDADEQKISAKDKDIYPLWQRILSDKLGVDLEYFKNKTITRGDEAVNLYNSKAQKETIKNITKAMLGTMSVKDVFSTQSGTRIAYTNQKYAYDGTRQIDWKQTYKNFTTFATSLESAASVTRAYADSLNEEKNTLIDFLSSSFTTTEDAEKIYDKDYQEFMKENSKKLKAVDQNAWDVIFEELADGTIKMRENATTAAEAILRQTEQTRLATNAMADFKESIESTRLETEKTSYQTSYRLGALQGSKYLAGHTEEESMQILDGIFEIIGKAEYKNLGLTKDNIFDLLLNGEQFSKEWAKETSLKNVTESYNSSISKSDEKIKGLQGIVGTSSKKDLIDEISKSESTLKQLQSKYESESDRLNNLKKGSGMPSSDYYNSINTLTNSLSDLSQKIVVEKNNLNSLNKTLTATKQLETETLKNKKLKEEKESEIETINKLGGEDNQAINDLIAAIDLWIEVTNESIAEQKKNEAAEGVAKLGRRGLEEGEKPLTFKNILSSSLYKALGNENGIIGNNTFTQQMAMDFMGYGDRKDYSFETWKKNLFYNSDGAFDSTVYKDFYNKMNSMGLDTSSLFNPEGMTFWASDSNSLDAAVKASAEFAENLGTSLSITKEINTAINEFSDTLSNSIVSGISSGINDTMKQLGQNITDLSDISEDLGDTWKGVAQSIFEAIGPTTIQTGLTLAAQSAIAQNWGGVAAGLIMAGSGAVASFLGGVLSDNDDDTEDESAKLQSLKDLLADLIEQARTDAEYYEKNLRHKSALDHNDVISVNDAVITPAGKVVSTAPDDYLIATKTPGSLGTNKNVTVNFSFVDQTQGGHVETKSVKQKQNSDGSIDIVAVIGAVMDQRIASGEADGALAAREIRLNGQSFSM
jgi:tape measure domain-containing protein